MGTASKPREKATYVAPQSDKDWLLIEQRKEELARLMTQEMGKVLKEARGDVQEAIDMGKYAAGFGRRPFGETASIAGTVGCKLVSG